MPYVCIVQLKITIVLIGSYLRITTAIALGLVLLALPGQAQLAYTSVPQAKETAADADPEAGKAAGSTAYKMVHGVVQGRQGALPGATVWLQGSRTIVVTNSEGEFELRVPADAKVLKLTCAFGGLQDEVVTLAPVQALGSIYLLRPTSALATPVAAK